MTLSRCDRAAMTLALEKLRERGAVQFRVMFALDALDLGDDVSGALWSAARYGAEPSHRILRARLALALRVLLRVDRGDFGAVRCTVCNQAGDHTIRVREACAWCWMACREPVGVWAVAPVRPLWLGAPAHEAAR